MCCTGLLKYCCMTKIFRMSFKVLVLSLCTVGFCYQVYEFLTMYWKYPTMCKMEITYPFSIAEPAITVCSYNGFNISAYCDKFHDECAGDKNITAACQSYRSQCDRAENETIKPLRILMMPWKEVRNLAPQRLGPFVNKSFIPLAPYSKGDAKNMRWTGVMDSSRLPNICTITYSLLKQPTAETNKLLKTRKMRLNLTAAATDISYQLAVHDPRSLSNPFLEGYFVRGGRRHRIKIKKTVSHLLKAPYSTNCTDYEEMWRSRGGKGPLSQLQCIEECVRNETIETKKCSSGPTFDEDEIFCNIAPSEEQLKVCEDQCAPACNLVEYNAEIMNVGPLAHTTRNITEMTTILDIEFRQTEVTTYEHTPKYEEIEIFCALGGYLGLWLGVSLTTFFDLIQSVWNLFKSRLIQPRTLRNTHKQRRNVKELRNGPPGDETLHLRQWLQKNAVSNNYYSTAPYPGRKMHHMKNSVKPDSLDSVDGLRFSVRNRSKRYSRLVQIY